jgi:hypothetical protein
MKNLYLALLSFLFFNAVNAQIDPIINIPDANFKSILLYSSPTNSIAENLAGNFFKIDANSDGEIQISEAQQVLRLLINRNSTTATRTINDITGILSFSNLISLQCISHNITSLDISNHPNIQYLYCGGNNMTNLNVSNCPSLSDLAVGSSLLSSFNSTSTHGLVHLELSFSLFTTFNPNLYPNLTELRCNNNLLTSLDVSNCHNLYTLYCQNNQLRSIIIKNGSFNASDFRFFNNPNLNYICCDSDADLGLTGGGMGEVGVVQNNLNSLGYSNCVVNSYCTFTPGGTFYTINGNAKYDINSNGCDALDITIPNLRLNQSTSGNLTGVYLGNATGNYSIPVQAGTHTITPILQNPTYFTVSPTTATVTFPTATSPFTQNFCVTANGTHPDLEVNILPINRARPGFDATYKIVYKNKGTNTQSGTVNLQFDDAVLDFVSATPTVGTQTVNNLNWAFSNLLPFESRSVLVTLNLNSPMETPPLNSGSVLVNNATITSPATDDTPLDNTFAFNQTVVNAYDPNDKTCLQGTTVGTAKIGDFVHYMIRFQNDGTAAAQNIVVKDMIDTAKFDIATLIPVDGSHSFTTKISETNKVEFIFQNINLPFATGSNQGFVSFKIKTKSTLVLGNSFSNSANIYFDYNFPIVTNTYTTTIAALATQDFEFSKYFSLYPNPAKDILNIEVKNDIEISSISVYNMLGQLVLVSTSTDKTIDVSGLRTGNYFVKITTEKGSANSRFVKE